MTMAPSHLREADTDDGGRCPRHPFVRLRCYSAHAGKWKELLDGRCPLCNEEGNHASNASILYQLTADDDEHDEIAPPPPPPPSPRPEDRRSTSGDGRDGSGGSIVRGGGGRGAAVSPPPPRRPPSRSPGVNDRSRSRSRRGSRSRSSSLSNRGNAPTSLLSPEDEKIRALLDSFLLLPTPPDGNRGGKQDRGEKNKSSINNGSGDRKNERLNDNVNPVRESIGSGGRNVIVPPPPPPPPPPPASTNIRGSRTLSMSSSLSSRSSALGSLTSYEDDEELRALRNSFPLLPEPDCSRRSKQKRGDGGSGRSSRRSKRGRRRDVNDNGHDYGNGNDNVGKKSSILNQLMTDTIHHQDQNSSATPPPPRRLESPIKNRDTSRRREAGTVTPPPPPRQTLAPPSADSHGRRIVSVPSSLLGSEHDDLRALPPEPDGGRRNGHKRGDHGRNGSRSGRDGNEGSDRNGDEKDNERDYDNGNGNDNDNVGKKSSILNQLMTDTIHHQDQNSSATPPPPQRLESPIKNYDTSRRRGAGTVTPPPPPRQTLAPPSADSHVSQIVSVPSSLLGSEHDDLRALPPELDGGRKNGHKRGDNGRNGRRSGRDGNEGSDRNGDEKDNSGETHHRQKGNTKKEDLLPSSSTSIMHQLTADNDSPQHLLSALSPPPPSRLRSCRSRSRSKSRSRSRRIRGDRSILSSSEDDELYALRESFPLLPAPDGSPARRKNKRRSRDGDNTSVDGGNESDEQGRINTQVRIELREERQVLMKACSDGRIEEVDRREWDMLTKACVDGRIEKMTRLRHEDGVSRLADCSPPPPQPWDLNRSTRSVNSMPFSPGHCGSPRLPPTRRDEGLSTRSMDDLRLNQNHPPPPPPHRPFRNSTISNDELPLPFDLDGDLPLPPPPRCLSHFARSMDDVPPSLGHSGIWPPPPPRRYFDNPPRSMDRMPYSLDQDSDGLPPPPRHFYSSARSMDELPLSHYQNDSSPAPSPPYLRHSTRSIGCGLGRSTRSTEGGRSPPPQLQRRRKSDRNASTGNSFSTPWFGEGDGKASGDDDEETFTSSLLQYPMKDSVLQYPMEDSMPRRQQCDGGHFAPAMENFTLNEHAQHYILDAYARQASKGASKHCASDIETNLNPGLSPVASCEGLSPKLSPYLGPARAGNSMPPPGSYEEESADDDSNEQPSSDESSCCSEEESFDLHYEQTVNDSYRVTRIKREGGEHFLQDPSMSREHGVDYRRVNTGLFDDDGDDSFDANSVDVEVEEEGENRRKRLRQRTAFCLAPMAAAFLLFCIFFYSKPHGAVEKFPEAKEEEFEDSKVSTIEGKNVSNPEDTSDWSNARPNKDEHVGFEASIIEGEDVATRDDELPLPDTPSGTESALASLITVSDDDLPIGRGKSYGIFFDVETAPDTSPSSSLVIAGVDLYLLDPASTTHFEVWTKSGSWRESVNPSTKPEDYLTGYRRVSHGTIVGRDGSYFSTIPLGEFEDTAIAGGGARHTFWISLSDDILLFRSYDGKGGGSVTQASNNELRTYYGTAVRAYPVEFADPSTDLWHDAGFLGRIWYRAL